MIAAPYRKARIGRYVVLVERLRFIPVTEPRVFCDGSVEGATCLKTNAVLARASAAI